jgi:exopolysaccharide biosynthesis predicted pyruvyltransferase EpsI
MRFDDSHFDELLEVLRGHTVGLAVNHFGNFGDGLIHFGTLALLQRHNISCHVLSDDELATGSIPANVTLIAEPGGGNLGARPGLRSPERRRVLGQLSCRKLILPQSASDAGEDLASFDIVFARERTTYSILQGTHRNVKMAPDLALALDLEVSQPMFGEGSFFRNDVERTSVVEAKDPVQLVTSLQDYVALAGCYCHVVTNRLHFGIAALLQGQAATLTANSYHKNRSMFDTWLRHFPKAAWRD